ncbi:epimerase [Microbacterium aerolatum]|uniref:epimerase n=1 Tax=Microbacterium aerolatum TaxID=153731 RepID=UPI00384AA636
MTTPKRAVLGGGSGFLGTALAAALEADGYQVSVIGRSGPDARWDDPESVLRVVDGAELVIGLAGKIVDCRYNDANRNEILRSRLDTTRLLGDAIAQSTRPPALWMNSSSATVYRYALDRPQTEVDTDYDTGFSPDVALAWEEEFYRAELPATRRVALRTTIVLGDGPATRVFFRLARFGLGGPQIDGWWFPHRRYRGIGPHPTAPRTPLGVRSKGRQKFSWIHVDDFVDAVRFIRDTPSIRGAVNMSAPTQTDNLTLMATLRRIVRMPLGLPAWRFMLEPAMWVLRTEPELVLKSRWVAPQVLLDAGYRFRFRELEPALRDIRRKDVSGRAA